MIARALHVCQLLMQCDLEEAVTGVLCPFTHKLWDGTTDADAHREVKWCHPLGPRWALLGVFGVDRDH